MAFVIYSLIKDCIFTGFHNVSREESRRAIEEHPTEPMEDGQRKIFQRKIPSKGKPKCRLSSLYFTVLKENRLGATGNVLTSRFYAIVGNFKEVDFVPLEGFTHSRKYERQIAFIECRHGWINYLTTFEQSLGTNGPIEYPRNCGIGTVLTELCLIDPDLNVRRQGNEARLLLEGYPEFDMIEQNCDKLMGLSMEVDDITTGYVYFTAAINMGYMNLIIDEKDKVRKGNKIKWKSEGLKIYPTKVAKQNFDTASGAILPCCDNPRCNAHGNIWFFCKGTGLV